MNKSLLYFCFACCLATSCGTAVYNDADESILNVVKAFHASFDAKDLPALTALCDEDMFWYTLNGRALHRNALTGFFLPMFANWQTIQTRLSDVQVRRSGRLAVVRYKSVVQIKSSRNESTMENLLTTVLLRERGDWKIWQHQMSTQ